jgi:hypothetical protein
VSEATDTIPGALDDLRERVQRLEASQARQTAKLDEISETVTTVRDFLVTTKTIGGFARWAGPVLAGAAAGWAAIKAGHFPWIK